MRYRSAAMLWVAALVGACGSSDPDPNPNPTVTPNEIVIGSAIRFAPAQLTVPVGTTVRWRNEGPYDHTVTSGTSSIPEDLPGVEFDTALPSGGTFEFKFDKVGNHPFFCRPHESMGMHGVVTVTAGASGADAGTAASGADAGTGTTDGTPGDGY